jgi:hypothetical protein
LGQGQDYSGGRIEVIDPASGAVERFTTVAASTR